MKKIILALCLILLSSTAANFGGTALQAAEGSQIRLTSQAGSVYVGDTVKLQLTGEGFDDLFGVETVISYDTAVLQVLNVQVASAYDHFDAAAIDDKEGELFLPLVRRQLQSEPQASIALAEITFKTLQAKKTNVQVLHVKAVSSEHVTNQQGYKDLKVLTSGIGEAASLTINSRTANSGEQTGSDNNSLPSGEIAEKLAAIAQEKDAVQAAVMLQKLIAELTSEPTATEKAALLKAAAAAIAEVSQIAVSSEGAGDAKVYTIAADDLSLRQGLLTDMKTALGKWNMSAPEVNQAQLAAAMTYTLDGRDVNKLGVYRYNEASDSWEYVRTAAQQINEHQFIISGAQVAAGIYRIMEYAKAYGDTKEIYAEAQYAIEVLTAKHIVNGTSDTLFSPGKQVTRAEFTSMLVRALFLDQLTAGDKDNVAFSDIASDAWYYQNVEISSRLGIINGFTDGTFRPNEAVTREQMVVIAMSALNKLKLVPSGTAGSGAGGNAFVDDEAISIWAKESIGKARELGLVSGTGHNQFMPKQSLNRADAAVFLWKLLQQLN